VPALENVASMDTLPPTGFRVMALPMKIAEGTGGPCRVVAVVGE
jgi:kynurenine formamidase